MAATQLRALKGEEAHVNADLGITSGLREQLLTQLRPLD